MTTARAATREDEYQRVLEWRQSAFQELGVLYPDSWELALSEANLHDAQQMVENGCPPELLRGILI